MKIYSDNDECRDKETKMYAGVTVPFPEAMYIDYLEGGYIKTDGRDSLNPVIAMCDCGMTYNLDLDTLELEYWHEFVGSVSHRQLQNLTEWDEIISEHKSCEVNENE